MMVNRNDTLVKNFDKPTSPGSTTRRMSPVKLRSPQTPAKLCATVESVPSQDEKKYTSAKVMPDSPKMLGSPTSIGGQRVVLCSKTGSISTMLQPVEDAVGADDGVMLLQQLQDDCATPVPIHEAGSPKPSRSSMSLLPRRLLGKH